MIITQTNPILRVAMIPFALGGFFFLVGGGVAVYRGEILNGLPFILIGFLFSLVSGILIHCPFAKIHRDHVTLYHPLWFGYRKTDISREHILGLELIDDYMHFRGGRKVPAKALYLQTQTSPKKYLLREAAPEKKQQKLKMKVSGKIDL